MTSFDQVDFLNGHQFEYYCADLLRLNGYENVKVTPGSGDNGIDILASKDGVSYAIQCKCYSKKVGNHAVQEAFTGKAFYKCDRAIVVTNNYFTDAAITMAKQTDVILWDRSALIALDRNAFPMNNHPPNPKNASNNINSSGNNNSDTCCISLIILGVILWALIYYGIVFFSAGNKKNIGKSRTPTIGTFTPSPKDILPVFVTNVPDNNDSITMPLYPTTSPFMIVPTNMTSETKELTHLGIIETDAQVGGAYIYQSPNSESAILRWIYDGTVVEILGITSDQLWFQVHYEEYDLTGWIQKSMIFDYYQ